VIVIFVVQVTVLQILLSVPATVFNVLVLVQTIAVQQMILYVLAIVVFVLVLIQNIAVREVMVFVQVLLVRATAQAVTQYGIVNHVLTLMVYADIQRVAVLLAAMRMIMVGRALPAKPVVVELVLLSLLVPQGMIVPPPTTAATGMVVALPQFTSTVQAN